MKTITKNEMIELFNGVEKGTFINLTTETKVRMNKTGNPYFDKVVKRSSGNFYTGSNYESRVQTNRTKEGNEEVFEVKENNVGQHVSKCILFNEKHNKHYLFVERFDEIKPKVDFQYEGNPIDKMLFQDFMVKSTPPTNQGVERTVNVLSYGLDSIKEFTLNKVRYQVQH
jgi:hypothetical protein